MHLKKYKTDRNKLLEEGMKIVRSSEDAELSHRVTMVNLVVSGMLPAELSKYAKESPATIALWVKTADEHGFEALRRKKQSGRPSKLDESQKQSLIKVLKEDPSEHGYMVWDGPSLSDYIRHAYGVKLSIRQCQRLFRELGFSLIRPQPYPNAGENNEEKRDDFKKN